jgi:hypothetical protein
VILHQRFVGENRVVGIAGGLIGRDGPCNLIFNDTEARFATSVNGAESLQSVAKKLNLTLNEPS